MKINLLKSYCVYDYKKGIIICNNASEMAFNKDIQAELRILGGSLFKGTNIETFVKANPEHKIAWIKDTSKRKTPDKGVFWSFIFAGYKKPVLEQFIKALKNPSFRITDLHKVTTDMQDKVKALSAKYVKPEKKAKPTKKAETSQIKALNDQIAKMEQQLAEFKKATAKK